MFIWNWPALGSACTQVNSLAPPASGYTPDIERLNGCVEAEVLVTLRK